MDTGGGIQEDFRSFRCGGSRGRCPVQTLDLNIPTALSNENEDRFETGDPSGDRSIQLRLQGPHLRSRVWRVKERPHRATEPYLRLQPLYEAQECSKDSTSRGSSPEGQGRTRGLSERVRPISSSIAHFLQKREVELLDLLSMSEIENSQ